MHLEQATRIGVTLILCLSFAGCGGSVSTVLEAIPSDQATPARPVGLPVVPVCIGVPLEQCRDMATTWFEGSNLGEHQANQVVRITVRCSTVCTPRNGDGDTRIDFTDGTNLTSGWGYASS